MIAFPRNFEISRLREIDKPPYEVGSLSKPLPINMGGSDSSDLHSDSISEQVKDCLNFYTSQLESLRVTEYGGFVDFAVSLVPEYVKRGLGLEPHLMICDDPMEHFVGVAVIFPSQKNYPFVEYYPYHKRVGYPYNPASPYSFLVNLIRMGEFVNEDSRTFARDLVSKLDCRGRLNGRKKVKKLDVKLFKDICEEFLD